MGGCKVISADSHAEEPNYLYDRLPTKYRHRAPRIETINDREYFIVEGQSPQPLDTPNPLTDEDRRKEFRLGDDVGVGWNREGGTNIPLRLADLDEDGISAEVIYPNGLFKVFTSPDPEYQLALARVYNDWYAEVFEGHRDRFVPSALIPMGDIDKAISEVNRVAKLGYRTISLPVSVPALPYNRPEYEPFWATLEEMRLPVAFHVFTRSEAKENDVHSKGVDEEYGHGEDLIEMVLGMAEAMSPLSMLIASGVLQRHPHLKFILVECGIGWLAWFLYAMDEIFHKRHMWQRPKLEMLPSEFFKRQGHITFGDDSIGLKNRDVTGVDCLMWGSDYPHDEGTFPHSREVIERIFGNISEDEKRKMVGGNAANLYGLSLD